MIDFKNYERLTQRTETGKVFVDFIASQAGRIKTIDRLAKLEDMIEQGKLVEKIEPKTAKEQVETELVELVERKNKLFNFLLTDKYNMLDIKSKDLLNKQLGIMIDFIEVLELRLNNWEE